MLNHDLSSSTLKEDTSVCDMRCKDGGKIPEREFVKCCSHAVLVAMAGDVKIPIHGRVELLQEFPQFTPCAEVEVLRVDARQV